MSIKIIVDAKLKPEKVDDVRPFFSSILPDTRNFEGCEGIKLCFNEDDPTNLILIEQWAKKEDYEKYHNWR
ncbi:MAG: antibiotic biosynthesis monooxygenase, partial [Candidatus Dadabacteria bacterium]|nr:antibiotic biosynthesis monooxygenase [Candidatus Dadabacteria bacterium]NIQ13459.1 antibiotic biosynthesis monooxygenase [Candidatus Dadabacteria bacterium]